MDIIYKKNTLYVYVRENIDESLAMKIENKVNSIMGIYGIDHLVIRTNGQSSTKLKSFESRYNSSHHSKVIIK